MAQSNTLHASNIKGFKLQPIKLHNSITNALLYREHLFNPVTLGHRHALRKTQAFRTKQTSEHLGHSFNIRKKKDMGGTMEVKVPRK